MHIANVLTRGPVTIVIDHEGIQRLVLDGEFKLSVLVPGHAAHLQRVGLPHHDEHLDGLCHISRLAIWIGNIGRIDWKRKKRHHHGSRNRFEDFHEALQRDGVLVLAQLTGTALGHNLINQSLYGFFKNHEGRRRTRQDKQIPMLLLLANEKRGWRHSLIMQTIDFCKSPFHHFRTAAPTDDSTNPHH